MGTHLRVLGKSNSMNTHMTGFRWFSKIFVPCALAKIASALEGLTTTAAAVEVYSSV